LEEGVRIKEKRDDLFLLNSDKFRGR